MKLCKMLLIAASLVVTAEAGPAFTQDWPNGTMQLVIPSRPGGGTDIMGRIVADYLQQSLKVPVAVINQPGGGGTVAFEQVRTAAPDGQTLLFFHTGLMVNAHTGKYDYGLGNFTTVAVAQDYPPQVYAVGAKSPWKTMREFVADAKKRPEELTVGVGLGGASHFMAGELMMNEDIKLRLVEATAEVDKVAGVQGGHIHMGNLGAGAARQFETAGEMRGLCMIDPQPDPDYPEYPTCASQGIHLGWRSPLVVWGPAGMAASLVEKINSVIQGMTDDATVKERLAAADSAYTPRNVKESQSLISEEDAKIEELAKNLGIAK